MLFLYNSMNDLNSNVYIIGRRVVIPVVGRTEDGLYLEVEPVAELSLDDGQGLARSLLAMLHRGNPRIPAPQRGAFPKPVVLKYTKAKSWAAFEKVATCWSISLTDGMFRFGPYLRSIGRGFEEDPDKMEVMPDSAPLESVVHRLVSLMQADGLRD
jgi:hypothetical protein